MLHKTRPLDRLMANSLLYAEAVASEIRAKIVRGLIRGWSAFLGVPVLLRPVQRILSSTLDIFTENLLWPKVNGWLAGYLDVAKRLPKSVERLFERPTGLPPEPPKRRKLPFSDAPDGMRFPKIEAAAQSLLERNIMTRDEFDAQTQEFRNQAFTIANTLNTDTIEEVRNILTDVTARGPSLDEFRNEIEQRIDATSFGPAHLETVYRTNLQSAYRDGYESLMDNSIVADVFPYQAYVAIHDDRVRSNHLALEDLGLNGTNIYRRDDPFWDSFTPPNGYNCRCGTIPMTLQAAAAAGVREAKQWLDSGRPPQYPEFCIDKIPFAPEPGFGSRRGVAV